MSGSRLTLGYAPEEVHREAPWSPRDQPWHNTLREPRQGVCLHYDGSASDAGGLSWLFHPTVRVSYHLAVLDDGSWARIAPLTARAWHVGVSRPSGSPFTYRDGNSALYGVTILSSGGEDVTARQMLTAAWLTARLFRREGWDPAADVSRVTGHHAEAHPRGRKTDPIGADPRNPILSPDDVRTLLPHFRDVDAP